MNPDQNKYLGMALQVIGIAVLIYNLGNMIMADKELSYFMPVGAILVVLGLWLVRSSKKEEE